MYTSAKKVRINDNHEFSDYEIINENSQSIDENGEQE